MVSMLGMIWYGKYVKYGMVWYGKYGRYGMVWQVC